MVANFNIAGKRTLFVKHIELKKRTSLHIQGELIPAILTSLIMGSKDENCKFHITCISIISIVANIAMITHKMTRGKITNNNQLLFTGIGISNVLLSVYFLSRSFVNLSDSKTKVTVRPVHSVAYSFSLGLSCLHLFMNLAMQFNRYYVTLRPLKYSNKQEKVQLQRRLLLIVFLSSLAISLINGYILTITHSYRFFNWAMTASRFFTHIFLCVMFVKIFKKVKAQSKSCREEEADKEFVKAGSDSSSRIKDRDKYLRRLFTGISISFFIFNLPIMIAAPFHDTTTNCGTLKGRLMIVVVTISTLGLVFDPLWYFYLQWRIHIHRKCKRSLTKGPIPLGKYQRQCEYGFPKRFENDQLYIEQ